MVKPPWIPLVVLVKSKNKSPFFLVKSHEHHHVSCFNAHDSSPFFMVNGASFSGGFHSNRASPKKSSSKNLRLGFSDCSTKKTSHFPISPWFSHGFPMVFPPNLPADRAPPSSDAAARWVPAVARARAGRWPFWGPKIFGAGGSPRFFPRILVGYLEVNIEKAMENGRKMVESHEYGDLDGKWWCKGLP